MDISTLQAQIRAARQISLSAGGITFSLELPSDHAWRTILESNRDEAGNLLYCQAANAMLGKAITGWSGATVRDLLPDGNEEALDFSPAARAELLDARQDIADELMAEVGKRLAERRDKRDAARKN